MEEIGELEAAENEYCEGEDRPDLKPPTGFRWEINGKKYLQEYLAKGWLRAFQEIVEQRDPKIKIKTIFTGVYSPREYNFETDHVDFDLKLSVPALLKIKKQVLLYRGQFREYLERFETYHSIPHGRIDTSHCFDGWCERFAAVDMRSPDFDEKARYDYTIRQWRRAVCDLLEFWLFAFPQFRVDSTYCNDPEGLPPDLKTFEDNREGFRKEYDSQLESLSSNVAVSDCFELVPER